AFEERQLHDVLISLARTDNPIVRPDGSAPPFPLLDDVGNGLSYQFADVRESFATPVGEFRNSVADQVRCGFGFGERFCGHAAYLLATTKRRRLRLSERA